MSRTLPNFAVIFDMDGVLIDSISTVRRVFRHVLTSYGIDDFPTKHRGQSIRDWIGEWNARLGTAIDYRVFSRQAAELEMVELRQKSGNAHLIRLLDELQAAHVPLTVGTASTSERVWEILDVLDIRSRFGAIVTADDVHAHKPDPAVFLEAAKQINVEPNRCIVIEDSPLGIEGAHRGGMKAIGFSAYVDDPKSLQHADLIIRDFDELSVERLVTLIDSSPRE